MVNKVNRDSQKIAIKTALEDLGLEFTDKSLKKIIDFFDRHFRENINPTIMMDILRGLAVLHGLEDPGPERDLLLEYLYSYDGNFTSNDLSIIARVLDDVSKNNTVSRETMEYMHKSIDKSPWFSAFIVFLEQLFFSKKAHIDIFGVISAENAKTETEKKYKERGFEYYEMQGCRPTQEDSLVWKEIKPETLAMHTSEEIGHRLWTAYQDLDQSFNELQEGSGTTASTTICTEDALITATLSDTIAFAVINKANGDVEIKMLADKVRSPSDLDEKRRIRNAGGFVSQSRIGGILATPRSIGDAKYTGRCPDADINILDLTEYKDATSIQVITVCDGVTEPLIYPFDKPIKKDPTKEEFEEYFRECLYENNMLPFPEGLDINLAKTLAHTAYEGGSRDNISVSVQTVKSRTSDYQFTGMLGVYDGHGGHQASHFVAKNIIGKMQEQLKLSQEEYASQANSVSNRSADYTRDNPDKGDDLAHGLPDASPL